MRLHKVLAPSRMPTTASSCLAISLTLLPPSTSNLEILTAPSLWQKFHNLSCRFHRISQHLSFGMETSRAGGGSYHQMAIRTSLVTPFCDLPMLFTISMETKSELQQPTSTQRLKIFEKSMLCPQYPVRRPPLVVWHNKHIQGLYT